MGRNKNLIYKNLPSDPNKDELANQQAMDVVLETKKDTKENDQNTGKTLQFRVADGKIVYYRQSPPKASDVDENAKEEPEKSDDPDKVQLQLSSLNNDSVPNNPYVIPSIQKDIPSGKELFYEFGEPSAANSKQIGSSEKKSNELMTDSSPYVRFNRSIHTEYEVSETTDKNKYKLQEDLIFTQEKKVDEEEDMDVTFEEENETIKGTVEEETDEEESETIEGTVEEETDEEESKLIRSYMTKDAEWKMKIEMQNENPVEEIVDNKPLHEEIDDDDLIDYQNMFGDDDVLSGSGTDPDSYNDTYKPYRVESYTWKGKWGFFIGYLPRKVNLDLWYSKCAERYDVMGFQEFNITCIMMDPVTKCKLNGEPLDPVGPHRWATTVVCGSGDDMKMAQISGPNYLYRNSPSTSNSEDAEWCPFHDDTSVPFDTSVDPSHDENAPTAITGAGEDDGDKSPLRSKKNKFSKNTIPKSSTKRNRKSNSMNDSHVGEQTPHTSGKHEIIPNRLPTMDANSAKGATMRTKAVLSPQPIRVRDMPLPNLSWADSTELSLLMSFKEDIGISERCPAVFRRNPNLSTRMRAILFDWLIEVCDVYKLRRVTYYLAIDYIDRYLSRTDIIPKNHLQLLGITCLFIAAKVEEIYPPKLSELAYVTDGACTENEMLDKEMDILKHLRWDVNPMTVSGWLTLFLQLSCTTGDAIRVMPRKKSKKDDDVLYPQFSPHVFMTASMIIDLCSLDDGMLQFKYSVIAASVLYFIVCREKALFVSGYPWEHIRLCVEWMYPFVVVALRNLIVKPLPVPKGTLRNGSALRTINPKIILQEGHYLQSHVTNLKMLEEVYGEISEMRRNFKREELHTATGWSASEEGQGYDPGTVLTLTDPPFPRIRRSRLRTCVLAESSTRSDNTKEDPPVELTSKSDEKPCNKLNEIDGAVPPVKKEETHGSEEDLEPRSSPCESQYSSSLFSECSQDLLLAQGPKPPVLNLHYVDDDGNHVDRVFTEENSTEQANIENTTDQNQNNEDKLADSASVNNRGLVEERSNDLPLKTEQKPGIKRRRSEESEEKVSKAGDENKQPRKKSCYEKNHPCSSMLASPSCSGLYLQEGQEASFKIRDTRPEPSIVAPEPPEVFPTRGSDLRMQRWNAEQYKGEQWWLKFFVKPKSKE